MTSKQEYEDAHKIATSRANEILRLCQEGDYVAARRRVGDLTAQLTRAELARTVLHAELNGPEGWCVLHGRDWRVMWRGDPEKPTHPYRVYLNGGETFDSQHFQIHTTEEGVTYGLVFQLDGTPRMLPEPQGKARRA